MAPHPSVAHLELGFDRPKGHCEDLEVYVNVNRVFVEGMEMPFQFRVIPRRPGIKNLVLEIWYRDVVVARDEPAWELAPGMEIDIPIGYRPARGSYGKVAFRVRLLYSVDGQQRRLSNNLLFTIYRAQERARTVLENLTIDIKNISTADRGSESRVNNILEGMQNLLQVRPDDPISEFNLYDVPELWIPLTLWREVIVEPIAPTAHTPDTPPPEAILGRMTVRLNDIRLHLISNSVVQIGRSSECDIVARIPKCPEKPSRPANPNYFISRFHCRFIREAKQCRLIDKAWDPRDRMYKPSRNGIWLDGRRIPSGESAVLPEGKTCVISLGRDGSDPESTYLLEARIWHAGDFKHPCVCDRRVLDDREPACLVLTPRFHPRDIYVLLWEQIDLSVLGEQWNGLCVCGTQRAFRLRTGNRCQWLRPGMRQVCEGKIVEVHPYNPRHAATDS